MRHRFFFSAAFALAGALVVLAGTVPGCSNQGEGERCDTNDDNGGNDDCSGDTICYPAATLGGVAQTHKTDICCPSNRALATTSICALQPTPPNSDAAPPAEAGSSDDAGADTSPSEAGPDTATPDAGPDTSAPDAGPDTSAPDAPIDSPADSPTEGG